MSQNVFRTGSCNAKGCGTPVPDLFCDRHLAMVPPALRHVVAASCDPDTRPSAIITAAIDAIAHKESRNAPRVPRPTAPKPIAAAATVPKKPKPARRTPKSKGLSPIQLSLFDV